MCAKRSNQEQLSSFIQMITPTQATSLPNPLQRDLQYSSRAQNSKTKNHIRPLLLFRCPLLLMSSYPVVMK
ncbi:hypothetical protein B0T21DRAFT_360331 [Apiosordaria backusii]|uniref:Uncharacterized protein n=1 Tax=Apiosordaria backusii TaxID=314023 RepID=A0AA40K185_9PEZI|nr:hypothetical protein B0T21DRAFT_360331 [Apiosordaria backusii]